MSFLYPSLNPPPSPTKCFQELGEAFHLALDVISLLRSQVKVGIKPPFIETTAVSSLPYNDRWVTGWVGEAPGEAHKSAFTQVCLATKKIAAAAEAGLTLHPPLWGKDVPTRTQQSITSWSKLCRESFFCFASAQKSMDRFLWLAGHQRTPSSSLKSTERRHLLVLNTWILLQPFTKFDKKCTHIRYPIMPSFFYCRHEWEVQVSGFLFKKGEFWEN